MILLDTHVWLWWINAPERLSVTVTDRLTHVDRLAISPISVWEISMLESKGKLWLPETARHWIEDAFRHPTIHELALTREVAFLAGSDALSLHGDPADRMLAATAIIYDIPLVTRDRQLHECTQVNTLW